MFMIFMFIEAHWKKSPSDINLHLDFLCTVWDLQSHCVSWGFQQLKCSTASQDSLHTREVAGI